VKLNETENKLHGPIIKRLTLV